VKGEGGEGESKQKSFSIRGRIKKFFFSFVSFVGFEKLSAQVSVNNVKE